MWITRVYIIWMISRSSIVRFDGRTKLHICSFIFFCKIKFKMCVKSSEKENGQYGQYIKIPGVLNKRVTTS